MATEIKKLRAGVFAAATLMLPAIVSSCFMGSPHYISQRDPIQPAAPAHEISVSEPKEQKPLDLFVRQKNIKIKRESLPNETGSLTDLNDPRAYLFGFERPVEVGMFVDVKIASNRSDPAGSAGVADGASKSGASDANQPTSKDVAVESLLKALPSLDPAPENKPILLKSIKMQVLERFDNGDVLVMHRRRSIRDNQGAEVAVTARVPAEALTRPDNISTLDLADVDWRESFQGELAERKSANWEDEYSLRLSGFDETKSKEALGLDEKRAQLKSTRDKLETELKGFAGERSRFSSERSKLLEDKAQDTSKIADLEKKNAELQKKVDELTPKEDVKLTDDSKKPDAKDGEKDATKSKDQSAPTKSADKQKNAQPTKETKKPEDAKKKG